MGVAALLFLPLLFLYVAADHGINFWNYVHPGPLSLWYNLGVTWSPFIVLYFIFAAWWFLRPTSASVVAKVYVVVWQIVALLVIGTVTGGCC